MQKPKSINRLNVRSDWGNKFAKSFTDAIDGFGDKFYCNIERYGKITLFFLNHPKSGEFFVSLDKIGCTSG